MTEYGDTDRSAYKVRGTDKPLGKKRPVKKQSPPAHTQIVAPGAELPRPRQKKPHEVEADKPESYFSHEETVPMFDFEGGRGHTMRNPVRKKIDLQREAEIVERIHDVAVLAEPKDAARLLRRVLDLGNTLRTRYALNEAREYAAMLVRKALAEKAGKVEKRRVYLKPGQHAPPGYAEREGKLGGRYYEVGGREERHEPKPRLTHIGHLSAAGRRLAEDCLDAARDMGWFAQVDQVRAYNEEEWAELYSGRTAGPGGKVSHATPYMFYSGERSMIAIGPRATRDLERAAQAKGFSWDAKAVIQGMSHEAVHSRNPIRMFDYYGENALIEEALAEWLCPDLATKILVEKMGWEPANSETSPSSYWDEVQTLEIIAGRIVGQPFHGREDIQEEINRWKSMPPNERSYRIRRRLVESVIREDFPDVADAVVEEIANTNTQLSNWNALWYSVGGPARVSTMRGTQHSCYQAAKAMLAERGELPDWAKGEEIRAAARERVKRWRERIKEEGRHEVRGAKRPAGWAEAIRDKQGLGLADMTPENMARLRRVLPNIQEVVSIGGEQYPLLARRTERGLSWYITDHEGKRISETVYGADGAAAFIEILKREEQRLSKDFGAVPPADAMVGDDVGPMAVGSAERRRARRKRRREGIFDAVGNKYRCSKTDKGRVYIGSGEEAPEGVEVREGKRGGRYYISGEGGGRVRMEDVPAWGDPRSQVDEGIHDEVMALHNAGLMPMASCEGHPDDDVTLSAYVSFEPYGPVAERLENWASANLAEMGWRGPGDYTYVPLPKGQNWMLEQTHRREWDGETVDAYVNFVARYDASNHENVVGMAVYVKPKANIGIDWKGRRMKHDPLAPSKKYTGKKPSQAEWDRIREESFDLLFDEWEKAGVLGKAEKQMAAGGVSSEDMGPRKVLEVPDTAKCDKGACEIFAETYGSEILTQAIPQEVDPNYAPVSVLYKAEEKGEREIVVGGYASPQVIDRERHLISRDAMAEDLCCRSGQTRRLARCSAPRWTTSGCSALSRCARTSTGRRSSTRSSRTSSRASWPRSASLVMRRWRVASIPARTADASGTSARSCSTRSRSARRA